MPATGTRYKQQATYALNQGKTSKPRFTSAVLHRKIQVDDDIVTIYAATQEQFYYYVYAFLLRHYETAEKAERKYKKTFDLDWSEWENRVTAINELDGLNLVRKQGKLPVVKLFVD